MSDTDDSYRVLARKYRPQTFAELIGQEAMVRTLENAIRTGRLAHAFVLTGVRGVGKTTTARIIAKGLNCVGEDGQGGPTTAPCGVCEACRAIAESRHVDVMEMDAASRTGVDDIREIIDGVSYRAAQARYKIYIIDEVHMLSKNAFNALLKTLEEPPEHVKFIFATTEIRKVPVTILSRCQRFDLKRVGTEALVAHLKAIAGTESIQAEEAALSMIARAAEGSVRDSLSLLDQAIAHTGGEVTEDRTRHILGLADRARVLDLAQAVFQGDTPEALTILGEMHDAGADAAVVLNDLLETVHWLTRLKITPDAGADALVSEAERRQGSAMAEGLAMSHLTRAWQMLLKGLGEVRDAPAPLAAAEMVLIRLCYAADLPAPADLVKQIQDGGTPPSGPAGAGGGGAAAPAASTPASAPASATAGTAPVTGGTQGQATGPSGGAIASGAAGGPATAAVVDLHPDAPGVPAVAMPQNYEALVALFEDKREGALAGNLRYRVRPVGYRPGELAIVPEGNVPNDLVNRVKHCLEVWTGRDWVVTVANSGGGETLAEKEARLAETRLAEARDHPKIKAVFETFPQARLVKVTDRQAEDDPPDAVEPADDGAPLPGPDDIIDEFAGAETGPWEMD